MIGASPRRDLGRALLLCILGLLALATQIAQAAIPAATVRIHYNRTDGQADTWQLYTWNGALIPSPTYVPAQSPTGSDAFGVYFDVLIKPAEPGLNFILHNADGSAKNCNDDRFFPFPPDIATVGAEIWQLQDDCTIYTAQPAIKVGDVNKAKAHFLTRDTIAWPEAPAGGTYRLYYSPTGGITSGVDGIGGGAPSIPVSFDAAGLTPALKAKFPHLASATAFRLAAADVTKVPGILRGQIVLARFEGDTLKDATSLQIPGVLDDLYPYDGPLGSTRHRGDDDWREWLTEVIKRGASPAFRVWAPTAQSVRLVIYDGPTGPASQTLPMSFDAATGVWSAQGSATWYNRKYYQYEVKVFVRSTGKVETNLVTDPYSLALSAGSTRTLVADIGAPEAKPGHWEHTPKPFLAAPEDIVLYETHVRDFSAGDTSVPAADRGKFRAFTHTSSNGVRHLLALKEAGLTHVHLLPSFDISSVPETGCVTPAVPNAAADSTAQQAAIGPVRDQDCFNWGYDPVHYGAPEGSYASDPNGLARVIEFRQMVESLHEQGLRVVIDVVYNHTSAGGQNNFSVLDRIVPGYYHRLNGVGDIESSTCCSNTASEHAMMGKLLIDTALTWVREYKIDGFRFDLMAFHPLPQIQKLRAKALEIDPDFYIYGEGWNFGEVANNARFKQTSQLNIAGTGIGTFSDRMRDGVRGGGPFDGGEDLVKNQGFINGIWYDPNALAGGPFDWQLDRLKLYADWIHVGLSGTLNDFVHVDKDGNTRTGEQIDYNGQPAGYVSDPQEVINYISAHDNQTLFDNNQFKLPTTTSLADRVRVNSLGAAIVALSQGVPFFHAGDDILRSKSLDRDSYNSGDWFNVLDLSYQSNNWGVGLPPAFTGNEPNWFVMIPLLADPSLKPGFAEITQANAVFRDFLKVRKSSRLFRLRSGAEIKQKLNFYNLGAAQIPGLIVIQLSDEAGAPVDSKYKNIVVLFNADKAAQSFAIPSLASKAFALHPVQAGGADAVVKGASYAAGTFNVPARTAAVFVEAR